jgi:HAE1 family hydrophobic/amphiphilic exporter-1
MSLVTLGSCIPLVGATPKGFLPVNDEARFQVSRARSGGDEPRGDALIGERIARQIRENPNVQITLTTVADDNSQTRNLATVYVALKDPTKRELTQNDLMDWTRHEIIAKAVEAICA